MSTSPVLVSANRVENITGAFCQGLTSTSVSSDKLFSGTDVSQQNLFVQSSLSSTRLEWNNGQGCYVPDNTRFSLHSITGTPWNTLRLGDSMDWEYTRNLIGNQLFASASSKFNFIFKPCTGYKKIMNLGGCWDGQAIMYIPACDDPDFVPVGIAVRNFTQGKAPPTPGEYMMVNKYFLYEGGPIQPTNKLTSINLYINPGETWDGGQALPQQAVLLYRPFDGFGNLMVSLCPSGGYSTTCSVQNDSNDDYDKLTSMNMVHNWQIRPIMRVIQDYFLGKIPDSAKTTIAFLKTIMMPNGIMSGGAFYDLCHQGGPAGTANSVCEAMKQDYCKDSLHIDEPVCSCMTATSKNVDQELLKVNPQVLKSPYCLIDSCSNETVQDKSVFKSNNQMAKCPVINPIPPPPKPVVTTPVNTSTTNTNSPSTNPQITTTTTTESTIIPPQFAGIQIKYWYMIIGLILIIVIAAVLMSGGHQPMMSPEMMQQQLMQQQMMMQQAPPQQQMMMQQAPPQQ